MTDITIYPSPAEQQLLKIRADQHGMTVSEFIQWLLQQSLTQTNISLQQLVN